MSGKQQQQKKGGGGDVCANPGCSKIGGGFKRCVRCQRVKYCSGKCSKAHWKNGHKKECKSWNAQNARDAARDSGSGEGAGAIAEPPSMKASNSPECPICLDIVVDPIRPCVEQPSHVFCRACIHSMEQKGCPSAHICPLCRGKLQSTEALYAQCCELHVRGQRLPSGPELTSLQHQQYGLLQEICRIDPKHAEAQRNLGVMY